MKHGTLTAPLLAALGCLLLPACAHDRPPPERTDDGLVRVASRSAGGVYRAPDVDFTRFQRLILETPTIAFVEDWRDTHREVTDSDVNRIREEAVKLFREEFTRELVERGPWKYAQMPDEDVLLVIPQVVELNIKAPDVSVRPGERSYTPGPVQFQVVGEIKDAASGRLVGRVIMYEGADRYPFSELRLANRTSNAHEMRIGFAKWARLVREALNLAKVESRG